MVLLSMLVMVFDFVYFCHRSPDMKTVQLFLVSNMNSEAWVPHFSVTLLQDVAFWSFWLNVK